MKVVTESNRTLRYYLITPFLPGTEGIQVAHLETLIGPNLLRQSM